MPHVVGDFRKFSLRRCARAPIQPDRDRAAGTHVDRGSIAEGDHCIRMNIHIYNEYFNDWQLNAIREAGQPVDVERGAGGKISLIARMRSNGRPHSPQYVAHKTRARDQLLY